MRFDRKAGTELEVNFVRFCEPTDREISGISCIPMAQNSPLICARENHCRGIVGIAGFTSACIGPFSSAWKTRCTILPDDRRNSSSLAPWERAGVNGDSSFAQNFGDSPRMNANQRECSTSEMPARNSRCASVEPPRSQILRATGFIPVAPAKPLIVSTKETRFTNNDSRHL